MKKKINLYGKRIFSMSLIAVIIISIISVIINPVVTSAYEGTDVAYRTSQSEIKSYTKQTDATAKNQISITSYYNADDDGYYVSKKTYSAPTANDVITIFDAKELYAFSMLCKVDTNFLTYNYQLSGNIDYASLSSYKFYPIGYLTNKPFSGSFDGQGYEIHDLIYVDIIPDKVSEFLDITYYAMFSVNNGTIKNFGLYNPEIVINGFVGSILGVAPLVGLNNGTIENVYISETRRIQDEAGLTVAGGYNVSGLIYLNGAAGTISDSYVSHSTVLNYTITDYISFREMVSLNNNTNPNALSNLYYYNSAITGYSDTEVVYHKGYIGVTLPTSSIIGTYVKDLDTLNTIFGSNDLPQWYVNANYHGVNIGTDIPILRGINEYNNISKTYLIENANDYAYMYELMNANSTFASSSYTYYIKNDIDLSRIPNSAYQYTDFISATIKGLKLADNVTKTITFMTDTKSEYPTIYNPTIKNTIVTQGIECYGLFPLFDGVIEDLNIYIPDVITNFNQYSTSAKTKSIGIVTGFLEGGTIRNVNVKANILLASTNNNLGRYYVGGITGIMSRKSYIYDVTVSGSIDGGTLSNTNISTPETGFASGNSMGGIVGFAMINGGAIEVALSAMDLKASNYTSSANVTQHIGGIIGCGYTDNIEIAKVNHSTSKLTNKGNITIDSTTNTATIYAAGIIGRHVGVGGAVESFHNQGNITYTFNSSRTAYISGVTNTDILTNVDGTLLASTFKDTKNKFLYHASSFTNSGNLAINNNVPTMSLTIANSLNIYSAGISYINSKNNFVSTIKGFFNLAYSYDKDNKIVKNLSAMEVDMASVKEFAPCIVASGTSIDGLINATTIYNLRNINYTTKKTVHFINLNYSGCISGKYLNLLDIRNEGNLSINFLHTANETLQRSTNVFKTLKIYGVFEEVSNNCSADTIFNGGDIKLYIGSSSALTLEVFYDTYISGICYANRNSFTSETDYNEYNPLNDAYDNTTIGSLNNVINNGDIVSNSYALENNAIKSGTGSITGDVRLSGVVFANEAIISNTFNLGNITNHNFLIASTAASKSQFEMASSGIAGINIGRYAQIRDCANNGTIKTYNFGDAGSQTSSAGIVGRNEQFENGVSYQGSSAKHHMQTVCFTINYGEIYAFSFTTKLESNDTSGVDSSSKSAGIIASGLCNVINVVNYGNIYGSEAVSGMFGVVLFYKFASEVTNTNQVVLANSLNYGKIWAIKTNTGSSATRLTYTQILSIDVNSASLSDPLINIGFLDAGQYVAGLISRISYASTNGGTSASNNAGNIKIRYLINFYEGASVIQMEYAIPTNYNPDNSTLIATTYPNYFMGKLIKYAPLNSVEDDLGNIGVFSSKFVFRQAIEGKNLDSSQITDSYLADYFEFIAFSKINQQLLENIGWRTLAYNEAAERFTNDLTSIINLLKIYNNNFSTKYNLLVEDALNNNSWIANCDISVLSSILESILSGSSINITTLKEIINYLFFNSNYSNSITAEMRKAVVERLLEEQNASTTELRTLLNNLLYSDLIAKIVSAEDSEYENIKSIIETDIESLAIDDLKQLFNKYLNILLSNDSSNFNLIFSDYRYINEREELLNILLADLDDSIYENILISMNKSVYSETLELFKTIPLMDLDAKNSVITGLLANNNYDSSTSGINLYISDAFKKLNLTDYFSETTSTTNLEFKNNVNDNVALWNIIKNSATIQDYLSNSSTGVLSTVTSVYGVEHKGLVAKATEFNNSYQSNDAPVTTTTSSGVTIGRLRQENLTDAINTRFVYVPDDIVSNKTYYYGPLTQTGAIYNPPGTTDRNQYMQLNVNGTASTTIRYAPMFISLDNEYLSNLISKTKNPTTYEFIWNNVENGTGANTSANSQYVSIEIITKVPADSNSVLYCNPNVASTNFYDFNTVGTSTTTTERNLNISRQNSALSMDYYKPSYLNSTSVPADINQYYLPFYISASILTGVWYQQNQWLTNGAYLTAKSGETHNNQRGVLTSSYITYDINDLVNLDGIKTKGTSTKVTDNDEVSIINTVMNTILATDKGRYLVMQEIAKEAEKGISSALYPYVEAFVLGLLKDDQFSTDILEKLVYMKPTHTLNVDDSNQTLSEAIKKYSSGLTYNNKERVLLYGVDDESNFKAIIKYLFENDTGLYSYKLDIDNLAWLLEIENSYSLDALMQFISILKAVNFTETQITNALKNVSFNEIENFIFSDSSYIEIDLGETNKYIIARNNNLDENISSINITSTGAGSIIYNGITKNSTANQITNTWEFNNANQFSLITVLSTISIDDVAFTSISTATQTFVDEYNSDSSIFKHGTWTLVTGLTGRVRTSGYKGTTGSTMTISYTANAAYRISASKATDDAVVTVVPETLAGVKGAAVNLSFNNGTTENLTAISGTTASYAKLYLTVTTGEAYIHIINRGSTSITSNANQLTAAPSLTTLVKTASTITVTLTSPYYASNILYATANTPLTIDGMNNGTLGVTCTTTTYLNYITLKDLNGNTMAYTTASTKRTYSNVKDQDYVMSFSASTYISRIELSGDVDVESQNSLSLSKDELPKESVLQSLASNVYELDISDLEAQAVTTAGLNIDDYYSLSNNAATNLSIMDTTESYFDGYWKEYNKSILFANSSTNRRLNFSVTGNATVVLHAKSNSTTATSTMRFYTGSTYVAQTISTNLTQYIFNVSGTGTTSCYFICNNANGLQIYDAIVYYDNNEILNHFDTYDDLLKNYLFRDYTDLEIPENNYTSFIELFYAGSKNNILTEAPDLWNLLTDEQLKELILEIANKDDNALNKFINGCNNEEVLREVIATLCQGETNFLSEVLHKANLTINSLSDEQKYLFTAAYVGSNYLYTLENKLLTQSELYKILNDFSTNIEIFGFNPQFITSNQTTNNDIFINLMEALGFNLSTDGFGIYAVSSSKGILNGNYMPDNVNLYEFDTIYYYDNGTYILLDTTDENFVKNNDWRGGESNIDGATVPITSDETSVNNKVYVDMKQLNKSIATTIFEIELVSSDGTKILKNSDAIIDLDYIDPSTGLKSPQINFYIPNNINLIGSTYHINTTIGKYRLSYGATFGDGINSEINTSGLTADGSIVSSQVVVIAEDTTVKKTYTINIIRTQAISMTLESVIVINDGNEISNITKTLNGAIYTTNALVAPENGNLILNFNTTNIANNINLKDKIYIEDLSGNINNEFKFNADPIVQTLASTMNTNGTWGSGILDLSLNILPQMPQGDYYVCIKFSDNQIYKISFKKEAATESKLLSINFEGTTLVPDNSNTIKSSILFGRAYSYSDLTDITNNIPQYLLDISVSPRATVKTDVVIQYAGTTIDTSTSTTIYNGGLLTYVITYTITSESGNNTTYTHLLEEVHPFENAVTIDNTYTTLTNYVSIYKDGEATQTTLTDDGSVTVKFQRGINPKYRIDYNLNGFYIPNNDPLVYLSYIEHQNNEEEITELIDGEEKIKTMNYYSIESKYYGLSINFTTDADTGEYIYNLVYSSNVINWNNSQTYTRIFETPNVIINKEYSTNAYLEKITFISSAQKISNIATVAATELIYPSKKELAGKNLYYDELKSGTTSTGVTSTSTGITYSTVAQSKKDYYIVGTISNAVLTNYAPTFYIEDYAKIYQYKIINDKRYLYVEFINISTKAYDVFLIDEEWSTVYNLNFDGSINNESISTLSINKSFNYDGNEYAISQYAGTTDGSNSGLNMDYIGTPEAGEFWYVDYVIYSEDFIKRADYSTNVNYKLYHVAIVDVSNTVYYEVTIKDLSGKLTLDSLYLTIVDYAADEDDSSIKTNSVLSTISGFASHDTITNTYVMNNNFQILQQGFFYFYLDLPNGYDATLRVTTANKLNETIQLKDGSYCPPSSIVTQKISVEIIVIESASHEFAWGQGTIGVIANLAELDIENSVK